MLKKNVNQAIILGALSLTILMNFQRVIIAVAGKDEFAGAIGLTLKAILLRMVIFFAYACTLLVFNVVWKEGWNVTSKIRKPLNVAANFGIFVLGVALTSILMVNSLSDYLENRQIIAVILSDFLIVHPILLLLARFIILNIRQQQIILEKEQAKQKALQHQLEALRSQINPHFLFNAMNSLTVLIRTKSDRALRFVDQLSWLLRATLLRSEEDIITIENELEYLESYIFLQKERFAEKLKVDIQIPEDWKRERIPSFSLQLLAENAIKHNVLSTKNPLLLEIYPQGGFLNIRNQIRRRRDATEGQGIGLVNLSTRFKILKKADIQINQDENFFTVRLPILKDEGNHN